jgi:hypothetical protein
MQAVPASTPTAGEQPPAALSSDLAGARPFSSVAASARGLAIGLALTALAALSAVAIASATVGYPFGRLG